MKYLRINYPGRKQAKDLGCSDKVSMHCQVSEDCTILGVTECPHGSLVWLDLECIRMKEDPHQSCNQSHLAFKIDTGWFRINGTFSTKAISCLG